MRIITSFGDRKEEGLSVSLSRSLGRRLLGLTDVTSPSVHSNSCVLHYFLTMPVGFNFNLTYGLKVCPWVHQVSLLHAISPISVTLSQYKGSTPKLRKRHWFRFWIFQGEGFSPLVLLDFCKKIALGSHCCQLAQGSSLLPTSQRKPMLPTWPWSQCCSLAQGINATR